MFIVPLRVILFPIHLLLQLLNIRRYSRILQCLGTCIRVILQLKVVRLHIFVDLHNFFHILFAHTVHERLVVARFRTSRPEIPLHWLVLGDVVVVALEFVGKGATLLYKLVIPIDAGIHVSLRLGVGCARL